MFLDGLFEQKAGGTFVGNFIRSAASTLSGGILGQGKNMINADGTIGNGNTSSALSDILATLGYVGSKTPQGQQIIKETAGTYTEQTVKNNWLWLGIIGVLGAIIAYLTLKK